MKSTYLIFFFSLLLFSCKKEETTTTTTPTTKDNFSFATFSTTDASKLQLAQVAVLEGNKLIFNKNSEAGSGNAIYNKQVTVADGFETSINFTITDLTGITDIEGAIGGDGISFFLFNSDTTSLKSAGWYQMPNSIATEIDTYANGVNDDPNGNHAAVYSFDADNNQSSSYGFATNIPNVSDGNAHTLKVVYKNKNYSVYIDGNATPYLSISIDLSTLLQLNNGKAYVGIACFAGLSQETHTVNSWSFTAY